MSPSPKKRAKSILDWYINETNEFTGSQESHSKEHARRCAIHTVELIISTIPDDPNPFSGTKGIKAYWNNVINELNKL